MVEAGFYHEFKSEVEDSETPGIIKPQSHWNAKHKPVKLLGYELVEEKVLPAGTTTCNFSGLNGDEDEEYLIEGFGTLVRTTDAVISLQPNGDSGSNYQGAQMYGTSAPSNSGSSISSMRMSQTVSSVNSYVRFKGTLLSKTGNIREYLGDSFVHNATTRLLVHYGCAWVNSIDNITSLVVVVATGSFSGTIRLWKKLPLNDE